MEKKGKNYFGLCPFHDEKTPSFSVSPEKNIANCFSCNKGGGPIEFYRLIKNISYREAAIELGKRVGIEIKDNSRRSKFYKEYEALEKAHDFYKFTLRNTGQGKEAMSYLKKRGLSEEVIDHFEIGLAPKEFSSLSDMLLDQEVDPAIIESLGLGRKSKKDDKFYDVFRNRIMFPIKGRNGQVIGFSGRALDSSKDNAKYINSQESNVFNKGEVVYHLYENLEEIKAEGNVVLVEGFFDVMALYNAGIKTGIATMGTALTDNQARLIKRYTDRVTVAYDGDNAGLKATDAAIPKLKRARLEVDILTIPDEMDPDDFLKRRGRKQLRKLFENEVIDSYRYYYNHLLKFLDTENVNSITRFQEEVNMLFKDATDVARKLYEKEISDLLGIDFKFSKRRYTPSRADFARKPKKKKSKWNKYFNAECFIIYDLIFGKEHYDLIKDRLVNANQYVDFNNYTIISALCSYYDHFPEKKGVYINEFKERLSEELISHLEKITAEHIEWEQSIQNDRKTILEYIDTIYEYQYLRKIDELQKRYDNLEDNQALEKAELVMQIFEIRRKLNK